MTQAQQLSLFTPGATDASAAPLAEAPEPTRRSSLVAATLAFHDEMIRRGLSQHTIKAFLLDLKLFASFAGADEQVGSIGSRQIGSYLHWLQHERDVKCSAKSLERRLTTLKVFFAWLADTKVIAVDPAAPLLHQPAPDPLPKILYEQQITRLLNTTRQMMHDGEKPDARPYLLTSLLLHAGIKKGECAAIRLEHIDLSDAQAPSLWVRYGNPRYARKERRLSLPKDFSETLSFYRGQHTVSEKLFECSMRNLEYILTSAGDKAGLSGVSFEALRMTAAVRDYKAGIAPETMRKKYGLSEITWNSETLPRIKQLAESPL